MSDMTVADRLDALFRPEIATWKIPRSKLNLPETEFTGTILVPRVLEFVKSLRHRSLVVNGDGFSPPSSLVYANMSFVPDIEILEFGHRLLAIEVKMIRDNDPTGAFTKSIGQAIVYKSLGFEFAHVVLIDCRNFSTQAWNSKSKGVLTLPIGIGVSVFGGSSGESLQMLYQSKP